MKKWDIIHTNSKIGGHMLASIYTYSQDQVSEILIMYIIIIIVNKAIEVSVIYVLFHCSHPFITWQWHRKMFSIGGAAD